MKAAPVSFTQDPREHVHFVMKFRGELCADEVGCSGPFASSDELHVIVVAAVLCSQRGAVEREHRANAEPRRGLVDVQSLFGAAGISPAIGLLQLPIENVDSTVDHLGWVDARAVGQFGQDLV